MTAASAGAETTPLPLALGAGADRSHPWLSHVAGEWALLALAAPFLLFPSRYTLVGAALLVAAWPIRRLETGRWTVPSPAHKPVLVLLGMLGVSMLVSVRLDYSVPKLWGLLLGLATFYTCLNTCRSETAARRAAIGLVAAGVAIAGLGLVGMATPPEKILDDRGIYSALPKLITSVQSSTIATKGIHPNELAGVLTLIVPLVFAFALQPGNGRWVAAPVAALLLVTMVVSQSRAGLIGTLAALTVGAVWRWRRAGLALVGVGAVVGLQTLLTVVGVDRLRELVAGDSVTAGTESLVGRVELWQRGLSMLLDMPFTGVGLNGYPALLETLYPTVSHSPLAQTPHAHDLYLQVALDFGVPGLLAFLALVALAVRAGLGRSKAGVMQPVAIGLLLGLLAHGIYSLVDAVTLGAKPGPVLWVVLGLLLAMPSDGSKAANRAVGATHASPALRAIPSRLAVIPSEREESLGVPAGAPKNALAALRRRAVMAAAIVAACLLLAAPLALNVASVFLHRSEPSPAVEPSVKLATALGWGPFQARAWNAGSLAAAQDRDLATEVNLLTLAARAQPWDTSLALRLGELRLSLGDRRGVIDAWRIGGLVGPALDRAAKSSDAQTALDWLRVAQEVDPADWRPYEAAARRLLDGKQPEAAGTYLSEALRLRGEQPARTAVAARLVNPSAALPRGVSAPPSRTDAALLLQASTILAGRSDLTGALYAAELAAQADGSNAGAAKQVAAVRDKLGVSGSGR